MSNDCDSLHYYYTLKKGASMRSTSDPLHVSTAERSELKTARAQCWIARQLLGSKLKAGRHSR